MAKRTENGQGSEPAGKGPDPAIDRRTFMAKSAAIVAGAPLAYLATPGAAQEPAPQPSKEHGGSSDTSRVVQVQSPNAFHGDSPHPAVVSEMIAAALTGLTHSNSMDEAWSRLLRDRRSIAIKFNSSAAPEIGTGDVFADALIRSLIQHGRAPSDVMPIECPDSVVSAHSIQPYRVGWTEHEYDFGSGRDYLANVLERTDALINVSFLKSHNIAGFTACMKNLSHGLIKHPARFHANQCSPYVADIVALPPIRNTLSLNIINCLTTVWDRGPSAEPQYMEKTGTVIAGIDAVAVDRVGLSLLNRVRQGHGLSEIGDPEWGVPYLKAAEERGLGVNRLHRIELQRIEL